MKITEQDFNNLWETSMEWGGVDWEKQRERFEFGVSFDWEQAYWFESYASLILARVFLEENKYAYQVTSDEVGGWILLTDYVSREVLSGLFN